MSHTVHVGSLEALLDHYPESVLREAARPAAGWSPASIVARFRPVTARSAAAALRAKLGQAPDWAASAEEEIERGLHQDVDVLDGRGLEPLQQRLHARAPAAAELLVRVDVLLVPAKLTSNVAFGPIVVASSRPLRMALAEIVAAMSLTEDELEFGRSGAEDRDARAIYNLGVLSHALKTAHDEKLCVLLSD